MNLTRKDYFDNDDIRWHPKERAIMKIYTVIHRYGKRIFREEYEATEEGMRGILEELWNTPEAPTSIRVFLDGKEVKL